MRFHRRAVIVALVAALMITASPASAQKLSCTRDHAPQILAHHGVAYPARFSTSAWMTRKEGKRFCDVYAVSPDNEPYREYSVKVSKNGKKLYSRTVMRGIKNGVREEERFTRAGRKLFAIKAVERTARHSNRDIKNGYIEKTAYTFRNANGSTGSWKLTATARGNKTTNVATIALSTAKKKKTRIAVREVATFGARVTVKGSMKSNRKGFRGSYHVTLEEKPSVDGLLISNGLAKSGPGKAVFNRVGKLELSRFRAARTAYARG